MGLHVFSICLFCSEQFSSLTIFGVVKTPPITAGQMLDWALLTWLGGSRCLRISIPLDFMSFAYVVIPSFLIFIMSLYNYHLKKKGCSQQKFPWKVLSFQGSPGFWSRSHHQNRWSIRNHTNTLNERCNDCLYNPFALFTNTHSSLWHFDRLLCSGFEFYWCFSGQKISRTCPKFQTCLTFSKHTGVHLVLLAHA